MTENTKHLFRPLEAVDAPDSWDEIKRRGQEGLPDRRRARRAMRVAALVAATIVVTFAIVAFLAGAFHHTAPPPSPATSPSRSPEPPVGDVALGQPELRMQLQKGGLLSVVEAYGSLWVLGQFDPGSGEASLRRFNGEKGSISAHFEEPFSGGGEWGGDGLIAGGGYIWAPTWNGPVIVRIDPATNDVDRFTFEGRVVSAVAFDETSGVLWAVVAARGAQDEATLVSIDPETGRELSSVPFTAEASYGVLPARGTVWTLTRSVKNGGVSGGRLRQLAPGTAPPVEIGGSFSLPVTDGEWIWSAASGDETAMNLASGIAQIDPVTGETVDAWENHGVGYDIAVGADRGVWFLGEGLERLNPSTGHSRSWSVGDDLTPIFIVPSRGGIWLGTYEGTLIYRAFVES